MSWEFPYKYVLHITYLSLNSICRKIPDRDCFFLYALQRRDSYKCIPIIFLYCVFRAVQCVFQAHVVALEVMHF